jgi:hypothetical protein
VWRKALTRAREYRERRTERTCARHRRGADRHRRLVAIVCVVVAVLSAAERADDVELQQERRC